MSRKPTFRDLPELKELFAHFKGFSSELSVRAELTRLLRPVIDQLRQPARRPFYSMRQIAAFFKVSLRSVSTVFQDFERQGVLSVVRGSGSIIEGFDRTPRSAVRGVVGIPVALPSFVVGNSPRTFYILLEEELRSRNLVADFIFYRHSREGSLGLVEQLLAHNLDYLFWMSPSKSARETILRLRDAGVIPVIVNDGKLNYPDSQYLLDWNAAFKKAAKAWKAEGYKQALVIMDDPTRTRTTHLQREIEKAFTAAGIEVMVHQIHCYAFAQFDELAAAYPHAGVIFTDHVHYEVFCHCVWRRMVELFTERRVLFAQGLPYQAAFYVKNIHVDTIDVSARKMAVTLAKALYEGRFPDPAHPKVFPGKYIEQTLAGSFDRWIGNE